MRLNRRNSTAVAAILFIISLFIGCESGSEQNNTQSSLGAKDGILEQDASLVDFTTDEPEGSNYKSITNDDFNDALLTEFSFVDEACKRYSLYQDIKLSPDFNIENPEVFKEIDNPEDLSRIVRKENNSLMITWNDIDGTVVKMETISPLYAVYRGIRVGDPYSKVMELYESDSNVYKYVPEENKYTKISEVPNAMFAAYVSDEGATINAVNTVREEIMTIIVHNTDGVVSKLEVQITK